MLNPDLIVCWPTNCDYPLWREYIRRHRERFNRIHIVFTKAYGQPFNFEPFVRMAMSADWPHFYTVGDPLGKQDWRDLGVKTALPFVDSDWIWFTEQDFIIKQDAFWQKAEDATADGADFCGVMEGDRLHPCSLLIKREVLKQTKRDFAVTPGVGDHFNRIQRDLAAISAKPYYWTCHFEHLAGLTNNFSLVYKNEQPNFHPERFFKYVSDSLAVTVPLSDEYIKMAKNYLKI